MVRLELKKFTKEQVKEVFKALLNGSEYVVEYTNKDGENKTYTLVKGGRLYFDNNFSICVSNNPDKDETYISIDYFSSDDRIRLYKQRQEQELSELEL